MKNSFFLNVFTALLGGAAAGLGGSLGAVTGGQPAAPNLNPPSQIDPSSIERAYAALGLTYQGNQIQTQTAQPNMSSQALQGQAGMRPLNPMSKLWFIFLCSNLLIFLQNFCFKGTKALFQSTCMLCVLHVSKNLHFREKKVSPGRCI